MKYKPERDMLLRAFHNISLPHYIITPSDNLAKAISGKIGALLLCYSEFSSPLEDIIPDAEEKKVYKIHYFKKLSALVLLLPDMPEPSLLVIGPYLDSAITEGELIELADTLQLGENQNPILSDYILSLPIISKDSHIYSIIDAFLEIIWESAPYALIDVEREADSQRAPAILHEKDSDEDVMRHIEAMERRYAYERELFFAVRRGSSNKIDHFFRSIVSMPFEKRLSDPVRNLKNYGVIMNTLLRKAAEEGGVHPVYIDKISGGYARKIEQMQSEDEIQALMYEMYEGYCRLVRKHSMKSYSPPVQKAIIYIDSNLSGVLSLSVIARREGLSPGYLSALFKKEVGITVGDFIAERRIEHAKHLLRTTHLQIQVIAAHCGFLDLQYFSKFFGKRVGVAPKEYRKGGGRH